MHSVNTKITVNRILLVDDDRHASEALAATLRILGYTVEIVLDGKEADSRASGFLPDMAIVDLNMPGVSGLEVMSLLAAPPRMTYCCLATGLADYTMLRRTLTAGAWTLMGKPFQIAPLQSILKTASTMIAARNLAETMAEALPQGVLTIDRRGDTPVNREDLARAMRFALTSGADKDTAMRRLPIVVHELLSNARQYGATESSEQWYRLRLENQGANMRIRVSDTGRGFGWARELIRARTTWDRVKASGLQLASALCEELTFSDGEFTAAALISKVSPYEQYMAASVSKAYQQ